jgi:ABC-type phosphate transport system substrate-binding protein
MMQIQGASSRRLLGLLVAVCGVLLALPAVGQAAFAPPYTTQCSGGQAVGINPTLQIEIASRWGFKFEEEDRSSPLSCAGRGPTVRYTTSTSNGALEALGAVKGVRNPEYGFAGNEEPPTLSQWLNVDLGDKSLSDSGLIRQIPVASTAVVPIVSFPEGCAIPAGEATKDGRFAVSNKELEKAYAGEIATWGELLPGMEGPCASDPIVRVVPGGSEGTTYVFKQWLNTVDASRGWNTLENAAWPKDSGATATVRSEEGDRSEARLVEEISGAIGFASLPSARAENFGRFSPENREHLAGLFWLSVENGAGERVEPTRDPNSGADNVLGANCDNPEFNYVPSGYDSTATPIWRYVTAVGSKTSWPICTLSYFLAWDDASTVYGNTEAREAEQRTVKDFLNYVLGPAGQEEAKDRDYSPLSLALLADAQEGANRVGWNKTPGSEEAKEDAVETAISAAEKHSKP